MSGDLSSDAERGWAREPVPTVLRYQLRDKLPCYALKEINKRQFLALVLDSLRTWEVRVAADLDKIPQGQAPARVRAREQLTAQVQHARTATHAVSAWITAIPEQIVRFFSWWECVKSEDTRYGSYDTMELHLGALLGEEPDLESAGREGCLLDVSGAFGEPLATRVDSLGS